MPDEVIVKTSPTLIEVAYRNLIRGMIFLADISGAQMSFCELSDPTLECHDETKRLSENQRLAALQSLGIMDTVSEPCFDTLARMAAVLMQTELASISFMDESRAWAKARVGAKFREYPRHGSFTERIILERRPLYILDLENPLFVGGSDAASPIDSDHLELYKALDVRFFAGVPVFSGSGEAVGALVVRGRQPRDLVSPQQLGMLERMAGLITDQLELRRLRADVENTSSQSDEGGDEVLPEFDSPLIHQKTWPQPEDLQTALELRQFVMHYQPEVDLETGCIIGLEALIRWQHPQRGLVPPMDFIPLAERSGLILAIGDWGMGEVCRQIRVWQQESPELRQLRVCVNLSARQFSRAGLSDHVEALLLQNGLSGGQLGLEMTETSLSSSVAETAKLLFNLQRLGVSLHLDDFGTGYSSLSHLHSFPFDVLKIDRSFVTRIPTGIQAARIVQTIVELAKVLHMDVIAEGIETEEQLRILRSMGCRYGQGFLFSRPLPAEQIGLLLGRSAFKQTSQWRNDRPSSRNPLVDSSPCVHHESSSA